MIINFKGKDIELKYSLRAMMMYENITDASFAPQSITDVLTFFYCIVVTSSKDYEIDFGDFIEYLDNNTTIINDFAIWMQNVTNNIGNLKKE